MRRPITTAFSTRRFCPAALRTALIYFSAPDSADGPILAGFCQTDVNPVDPREGRIARSLALSPILEGWPGDTVCFPMASTLRGNLQTGLCLVCAGYIQARAPVVAQFRIFRRL